ncbi:hypothetical protein A5906_30770 [Bradyrhizobium sacchari]|uniref:hypothetical protein n=1 Tax=Bradyrhizobium sacchari TaxID=1399419 RepID=UPI0009D1031B|nr:hypothetical protein [Bradyrhizobium sacchari]OPY98941.1 hypothetical protein A5906_30770 [Bradyrhizobium sacchari]
MAIVSVTVFAIVLCDQIDGKLAFDAAAEAKISQSNLTIEQNEPRLEVVADTLVKFTGEQVEGDTTLPPADAPLFSCRRHHSRISRE